MVDDVLVNKAASIERCLRRVGEEYADRETDLATDFTRQDALVLNLLRACETAIDMAMHVARVKRLGVPQSSRDAFDLLAADGLIDAGTADNLKRMVGFRNIAVHAYRDLDLAIVEAIVTDQLDVFRDYINSLLKAMA